MKIFITGATGFIGQHLCHRLVNEGHNVVALVRSPEKTQLLPKKNIEIIKGDLFSFKDENFVLPKCDAVIHLAGVIAASRLYDYDVYNHQAVRHMVACLNRQSWKPKRFLFASSLAASGPAYQGTLKKESDEDAPNEPYGQSKLDAEKFLLAEAPFPVTCFRPGAVLGAGDEGFLNIFRLSHRGYGFKVSGINMGFSFIYIDDLVEALMKLIQDESSEHRTYFTTHPDKADINELWSLLSASSGKKICVVPIPKLVLLGLMVGSTAASKVMRYKNQMDWKQYRQLTSPGYLCTSESLQQDFDWHPQHNFRHCVSTTMNAYREAGWL